MTPRFFVFTEGVTEKNYINGFRKRGMRMSVIGIQAGNTDPVGIVKYCLNELRQRGFGDVKGDDAAVVFDLDRNTLDKISEAEDLAATSGIRLFMSNPSFEFWLLLHFKDYRKCEDQNTMETELSRRIGHKYAKGEDPSSLITEDMVNSAISRSESILPDADLEACWKKCPSSMLHKLVAEILSL